jgi:hypothetical protein
MLLKKDERAMPLTAHGHPEDGFEDDDLDHADYGEDEDDYEDEGEDDYDDEDDCD